MALKVPVPAHVGAVPPYQPGRALASVAREFELQPGKIIKLASNENPLGMSPRARAALAATREDPARYPDADGIELKRALSSRLDVPIEWLTIGSGSGEILQMATRCLLAPGRSGVMSQYAFVSYRRECIAAGASPIVVPARDYGHDLDAMLAAIADDTSLVFLANPNNPTGSFLPPAAVADFIAQVPSRTAIILDEAYLDYLEPAEQPDSVAWIRRHPNLILARTFSKAHGMAGLRIGYGIAQSEMTELLNRLRLTFNVSSLAQTAALAALNDEEFIERSRRVNQTGMADLMRAFDAMGLEYLPSKGNFLMVRVGDAAAVNRQLLREGVIIRPIGNYGLPEWLRVTIGLPEENARFLETLTEALKASSKSADRREPATGAGT